MIRKYGIGLFVVILAAMAAAFTTPKLNAHPSTDQLYKFTGLHGQEANTSLWQPISSPSEQPCDNNNQKGCRITSSSSSASGHPTSVPLDAAGLPKVQSPTTSVTNTSIN